MANTVVQSYRKTTGSNSRGEVSNTVNLNKEDVERSKRRRGNMRETDRDEMLRGQTEKDRSVEITPHRFITDETKVALLGLMMGERNREFGPVSKHLMIDLFLRSVRRQDSAGPIIMRAIDMCPDDNPYRGTLVHHLATFA